MWIEDLELIYDSHSPPSNFPQENLDLKRRPRFLNVFVGEKDRTQEIQTMEKGRYRNRSI